MKEIHLNLYGVYLSCTIIHSVEKPSMLCIKDN